MMVLSHITSIQQQSAKSCRCPPAFSSRGRRCVASSVARQATQTSKQRTGVQAAKARLLQTIRDGSLQGKDRRAYVTEAQLKLERFGGPIDFSKLEGLWKLVYTTASDVAPLMRAMNAPFNLPLPRVSSIYQRFTSLEQGGIQNVITAGDGLLFESEGGVTFIVNAKFTPYSPRTIELVFKSARVSNVKIADALESFIAPALLPRSGLQHGILMGLRELKLEVPLALERVSEARSTSRGGKYQLTFIDDDVLIGRAQVGAGVFIFERSFDDVGL